LTHSVSSQGVGEPSRLQKSVRLRKSWPNH
jgi:hypothetical protein